MICAMDCGMRYTFVFGKNITVGYISFKDSNLYMLCRLYWHNFFKLPLDNMPYDFDQVIGRVRKIFLEKSEWYEVYDFVEFTAKSCPDSLCKPYIEFVNHILNVSFQPIDLLICN